jgi:hypothetical protein
MLESEDPPFRTIHGKLPEDLFNDEWSSTFTRGGGSACLLAALRLNRRIDDKTSSIKAVFTFWVAEDSVGIIYAGPHCVEIGAAVPVGMKVDVSPRMPSC